MAEPAPIGRHFDDTLYAVMVNGSKEYTTSVWDIHSERLRQRGEFTLEQDDMLTAPEWIARAAKHLGRAVTREPAVFRHAMVVVGAIALAAIEWHDRRYPR